jgi:hypothetical protein
MNDNMERVMKVRVMNTGQLPTSVKTSSVNTSSGEGARRIFDIEKES